MKAGRQACTRQAAQGLDSLASERGKAGWGPFQDTVRVGQGTVCWNCLAQMYGWFLIPAVHALSYTLTEPATSLCFCPSRFCKSYSVRKRTHRLILKAFGMLKRFPAGCITYSHPPPFLSQPPFWGEKHSTREPGSPKGIGQMGGFPTKLLSLLCPASHPVSRLQTFNTRPCTVVWMHKSPKPHTKKLLLQSWKAPGLRPRSSFPPHPHPFPWACFQSLQRTAEPGTGSATTSSLLCSGLPSCGPHSHLKTWFPMHVPAALRYWVLCIQGWIVEQLRVKQESKKWALKMQQDMCKGRHEILLHARSFPWLL